MSGEMSNMSQFCEFEWFEWVMFWDETAPYPSDHFRLGRYLGPNIDIVPVLTAKMIKENGQVLCRSTYQDLSQEEWEQEKCNIKCSSFMELLHKRLGPHTMVGDLVKLSAEDALQYYPYEDKSQNAAMFPILDEEPKVTLE